MLFLVIGLFFWQPWVVVPPDVLVELVAPATVTRVLAVNGRVVGETSVDISPLVSGRIVALPVRDGDVVEAGGLLARIDPGVQAAIVRQAVAGLDIALVEQTAAEDAVTRARALGSGMSRVDMEDALRARLTSGQEVARMTAILDQAQVTLSQFTLLAPFPGTVTNLSVTQGQVVDPTSQLMTLSDMDHLLVEAVVDESHALELRAGLATMMRLSGSSVMLTGWVRLVAQEVDAATGGLTVTLEPDAKIMAPIGLTVTANITIDDRAAAITVPRAAVVMDAVGTAVFIVQGEVAVRRAVSLIEWPAARVIVTEGLLPGDPVIADATGLKDGMAVRVLVP